MDSSNVSPNPIWLSSSSSVLHHYSFFFNICFRVFFFSFSLKLPLFWEGLSFFVVVSIFPKKLCVCVCVCCSTPLVYYFSKQGERN